MRVSIALPKKVPPKSNNKEVGRKPLKSGWARIES